MYCEAVKEYRPKFAPMSMNTLFALRWLANTLSSASSYPPKKNRFCWIQSLMFSFILMFWYFWIELRPLNKFRGLNIFWWTPKKVPLKNGILKKSLNKCARNLFINDKNTHLHWPCHHVKGFLLQCALSEGISYNQGVDISKFINTPILQTF